MGSLGKTDPVVQRSSAGLGAINHNHWAPRTLQPDTKLKCLHNFPLPVLFRGSAGVWVSTKGGKRKENGSQVMGGVWSEDKGDTGTAAGFTAAPLGPSSSVCPAGDATRKQRRNDVPTWNHGLAWSACAFHIYRIGVGSSPPNKN